MPGYQEHRGESCLFQGLDGGSGDKEASAGGPQPRPGETSKRPAKKAIWGEEREKVAIGNTGFVSSQEIPKDFKPDMA